MRRWPSSTRSSASDRCTYFPQFKAFWAAENTFDDLIKAGKARFEGDRKPFDQLRGLMVAFAPNFEILPGTAAKTPVRGLEPMAVTDLLPPDAAGD